MTFDEVRELARWQPPLGVLSIYLRFDPGDRGGAWRTRLRNCLSEVLDAGEGLDHAAKAALRSTAARLGERFANHERDLPRGEVGFVEVSEEEAGQRWWSTQVPPGSEAAACFSARPVVAPAVWLTQRDRSRGVVLVSAERVHLLEWSPGHVEELQRWELALFSGDWRERKAQRVPDPARAQGVSASGRDQFDERLAENRHRFLVECRRLTLEAGSDRGWDRILAFGPSQQVEQFDGAAARSPEIEAVADTDLISKPVGELEGPIAEAMAQREAERAGELVERALDQARGGLRGSVGTQETAAALEEGRVETLILDAELAAAAVSAPLLREENLDLEGEARAEALVRLALASGADVVSASGGAADLLGSAEGVASLLRY